MTVGFRILDIPASARVASSLVSRASKLPVANINDVMSRMNAFTGTFHPYGQHKSSAGPAFTVRTRAGDNLLLHRAIDLAEPGDIIVCDGAGDLNIALVGELMVGHAAKRGVKGIIIDGAIRDVAALQEIPIGVWARGANPSGPYKDGPGEIGVAIACGGQVIMPGDLVVADEDGIAVVPKEEAENVVKAAEAHQAKEQATQRAIDCGTWDRKWVEVLLREKGCALPDGLGGELPS